MTKGLEKIISELVELGYSERKIINRLKEIKETLITENTKGTEDKTYNKLINGLLFGDTLNIDNPSNALLGLIKNTKKQYGSEFVYYLLSNLIIDKYWIKEVYEITDEKRSNWLMYLIKNNIETYYIDYINSKKPCEQPI